MVQLADCGTATITAIWDMVLPRIYWGLMHPVGQGGPELEI